MAEDASPFVSLIELYSLHSTSFEVSEVVPTHEISAAQRATH
jgi:hypothetical protein